MKNLNNILENKFLVKHNITNNTSDSDEIINKLKNMVDIPKIKASFYIAELNSYAKAHNFDTVTFRNRKTNSGDFSIFLYNRHIKAKGYCIGWDGMWGIQYKNSQLSFRNCLIEAYQYIDKFSNLK